MNLESSRYLSSPKSIKSNSRKADELFSVLIDKIEFYDKPKCFASFNSRLSKLTLQTSENLEHNSDLNCISPKSKMTIGMPSDLLVCNVSRSPYSRFKGFHPVSLSPEPLKTMNYIKSPYKPIYITSSKEDTTPNKRSIRISRMSPVLSLEEEDNLLSNVKNKLDQHRQNISKQAMDKYRAWNNHGIFPASANKLRYQSLVNGKMYRIFKDKAKRYYLNARNNHLENKSFESEQNRTEMSRSTILDRIQEVAVRKFTVPVHKTAKNIEKMDESESIHYNARIKLVKRMVEPVSLSNDISMNSANPYIKL